MNFQKHASFLTVAVFFIFSVFCHAQTPEQWRSSETNTNDSTQKTDHYKGVTPGGGNTLPRVDAIKDKSGIWVTWPGFTSSPDGRSRVFIQTTKEVRYRIKEKTKKRIVVEFKKASIYLGNNHNPLVTTHFNTPLSKAFFKKRKKNLELVLELKSFSEPSFSQKLDQDGYYYFFIDFPSGTL